MASNMNLDAVGKLGVIIAPDTRKFPRELADQLKQIKIKNDAKPVQFKVALNTKSLNSEIKKLEAVALANKIEIPVGLNEAAFRKQVRLIKALAKAETITFDVAFSDKDVERHIKAIQKQIKNSPVSVPFNAGPKPVNVPKANPAKPFIPTPNNDNELLAEFRNRLKRAGAEEVKSIEKLYKEAASKLGTGDKDVRTRVWLQSKLNELNSAKVAYDKVISTQINQPNGANMQRNLTKQFEVAAQKLADQMDALKADIAGRDDIEIDVDADTTKADNEINKVLNKKRKPSLLEVKLEHRMLDGLLNTLAAIPAVTTRVLGLATAFTTVGAFAAAAVAGTSTLVASLKDLSGVAGLLPAAFGGLVAMGGTLAAAFSGIGTAISAVRENTVGGASSSKNAEVHAIQLQQARDAIVQAQGDIIRITEEGKARIVEASKAVGDAQRNIKDSAMQQAREVEQAEERLYKANRTATESQKKLNEVRKEARQRLKDLREELANASLDERKAAIEAEKARQRYVTAMNDGGATSGDTRNELLYEWDRAKQNLTDSKTKVKEVRAEKSKADKEGVNGTEAVIDAQEKMRDATRDQADAVRDLGIAQVRQAEAATDAQERLHDAQATFVKAQRDAYKNQKDASRQLLRTEQALTMAMLTRTDTASRAEDSMARLTAGGREFVNMTQRIMPVLKPVRDIAQNNFFAGWTGPLERMINTLVPQLKTGVGGLATEMGKGWGLFADGMRETLQNGDLALFFSNITAGVKEFNGSMKPLVSIFNDIAIVGSSFFPQIAKSITEMLTQFAAFISKARADGSLKKWIQDGIDAVKNLFGILRGIARIFGEINKAAHAAGLASTLKSMNEHLNRTADIMSGPVFQETLTTLFKGVKSLIDNLKPGFRDIGRMFVESDGSIARIMGTIGAIGSRILSIFAKLFSDPEVMAGLEKMFDGILKGLEKFNPNDFADGLGTLFSTIGSIAETVIPVISELLKNIGEIVQVVGPIIKSIMEFLRPLAPVIADLLLFLVGLKAVSASLKLFNAVTGKGPSGLIDLGKKLFGFGKNADDAGKKVGGLSGKFGGLWTKIKDVAGKIKGFKFPALPKMDQKGMLNFGSMGGNGLVKGFAVKDAGGGALGKASSSIGKLGGIAGKVLPWVGRLLGLGLKFVPVIGWIWTAIEGIMLIVQNWESISAGFANWWSDAQIGLKTLGDMFGNVGNFFKDMFTKWQEDAALGIETIKNTWNGFWGWVGESFNAGLERVGKFWNEVVLKWVADIGAGTMEIIGKLGELIAQLWQWTVDGMNKVGGFFVNLFAKWHTDVTTGADKVWEFFRSIPQRISDLFKGAGDWAKDAGKNLWDGFTKGMQEKFPDVTKTVDDIMKGVGDFFVNSPAKRGRFSGQGHSSFSGATLINDFAAGMRESSPQLMGQIDWIMNQLGEYFMKSPAKKGRFSGDGYSLPAGETLIEDFAKGMVNKRSAVLRAGDVLMNSVKLPSGELAELSLEQKNAFKSARSDVVRSLHQTIEVKEAVSARATAIEIARLSKVGI